MCITADDYIEEPIDLLDEKLRFDLWVDAAYESEMNGGDAEEDL